MTQQDPYGNQPYDPYGNQQPQSYNVDPPYGVNQSPQPDGYYPQQPQSAQPDGYYPQQPQSPQADGYYQQPAQYGHQQYTAPPYGTPLSMPQSPQNGLGIAALVLGIVSIVLSPCCGLWLSGPTGILAVVFGAIGMSKATKGEANNKGMALAGLICGGAGLVVAIVIVILAFSFSWMDYQSFN